MRTKISQLPAIMILWLVAVACEAVAPEPADECPVVEGWINSDGYPVVIFTSSLSPDNAGSALADKIIRWGTVTISDGSRTVVMTGGMSDEYFPPYRYYTFDMKGEPGKTYRIVAEYENLHAEAECRMPIPTPIDGIELSPIAGNDTLRSAVLRFTAPNDCPAYYCITVRDLDRGRRPLPAMMGTVIAERPHERLDVPVFNPKNVLDTVSFVPQLAVGQRLVVSLCRVTSEVYTFWNDYNNMTMFGGSQFLSGSTELRGNIAGGYGVWSAQGVSSVAVEVE